MQVSSSNEYGAGNASTEEFSKACKATGVA
jgi:hypothetical protein